MAKKSVLGKGIGALLSTSIATPEKVEFKNKVAKKEAVKVEEVQITNSSFEVDVKKIVPNPDQPRKFFKEEDLNELSLSIKENGIIQPIIVASLDNDRYEIVAGERRFRAAKLAGLEKVPVVIKKLTEKEKLAFAIIENVQRADLNCVEEALAYFKLMDEFKVTQEQVSKIIGKSRSTIANFLRILKLPKEVIQYLQQEKLSFGHAKILASEGDEKKVISFAKEAADNNWSVHELSSQLKDGSDPKQGRTGNKAEASEKYTLLREKLERETGFHIKIKSNKKNRGKIEINFNGAEEFDNIYNHLIKT